MRKVIVAWVAPGGTGGFERNVPLAYLARRNRQLGYANDFDVVFLEGLSGLTSDYRRALEDFGYRLIDAGALYARHAARHAVLARFGPFEKRCFLRWLVLADIYRGEPFFHVDGDVVFNDCADTLARCFTGRTMVLQGCPALAAISDAAWLEQYAAQLAAFCDDIEGYSAAAWHERAGWEISYRSRWAGSRDRRIVTSDQDLISHLIHTGRLRQDCPAEFTAAASHYCWFENPLHVEDWVADRPLDYRREGQVDYFNGKRVAIWHMQTDWCRYLGRHLLREYFGLGGAFGRLGFNDGSWEEKLNRGVRRLTRGRWPSRLELYRRFFSAGDFSQIFTADRWWREGVFAPKS